MNPEQTDTQMNPQEVALVEAAITAIDSTDGPPVAMVVGDVNAGEMALLCVAILVPAESEQLGRAVLTKSVNALCAEIAKLEPAGPTSTH